MSEQYKEVKGRLFEKIKTIKSSDGHLFTLWYGECFQDNNKHFIYIECDKSAFGTWPFRNTKKEEAIKRVEDIITKFSLTVLKDIDLVDKNLDAIL